MGKGTYHQAWPSKFHSQDLHDRHRELTNFHKLSSDHHICPHTNKRNFKEDKQWWTEFGHFLPLQWLPQMCFQPLCCMGFHFLSHRCGLPTTVDQSEPIPFKYTMETKIPALVWNVCRECEQPGSGKTREEWRTQEAVNEMQKNLPDGAAPATLGCGTAPSLPIPPRPCVPCPSVNALFTFAQGHYSACNGESYTKALPP